MQVESCQVPDFPQVEFKITGVNALTNTFAAETLLNTTFNWYHPGQYQTNKIVNYSKLYPDETDRYTLIVTNGCGMAEFSALEPQYLAPLPCPTFDQNNITMMYDPQGDTINFIFNPNIFLAGQPVRWDFGDGRSSTAINPGTIRYRYGGVYLITLEWRCGLDWYRKIWTVCVKGTCEKPQANFSFIAQGNTVSVVNNSWLGEKYRWDFGDGTTSTAVNPAPHSYPADGIYRICLKSINDCAQDSVCKLVSILTQSEELEVSIGKKGGKQNSVIKVPVTVSGFKSLKGLKFAFDFAVPGVGKLVDITDYHPQLKATDFTNNISKEIILWVESSSKEVSLTDGDLLFNLNIQLQGTLNSRSGLKLSTETTPEGIRANDRVRLVINPGEIYVSDGLDLAGVVSHEEGQGITAASVILTGNTQSTQLTDHLGNYNFGPLQQGNYQINVEKNSDYTNGVTSADLTDILRHLNLSRPFSSPFKRIAADVDKDKIISLNDVLIIRDLILGRIERFSKSGSWTFIPSAFNYQNPPVNDRVGFFEEQIKISGNSTSGQFGFTGIKMGDVNNSANPAGTNTLNYRSPKPWELVLRVKTDPKHSGLVVELINATDCRINSAQFTLSFDPTSLRLENYLMGNPTSSASDINSNKQHQGYLAGIIYGEKSLALRSGEVLFTFYFQSNKNVNAAPMDVTSMLCTAVAYDEHNMAKPVNVHWQKTNNHYPRVYIYPNPASDLLTVQILSVQNNPLDLRIYSALGQEMTKIIRHPVPGHLQELSISVAQWPEGVYYLSVPGETSARIIIQH